MPVFETPYGTVDAPDLGSAQKWIARQKPAGEPQDTGTAPAATTQPPEQKDAPGVLERLWHGMLGKDVSRVGRVGMGMADPVYGGAQIGARMAAMPGGGVPEAAGVMMPDPAAEGRIKTVDTAVQQREAGYEQREKAAGLSGGLASEWARLIGNVVSPVNLAAGGAGGAVAKGAGAAARVGMAAAGGAAGGAMEPVAGKEEFWSAKAKQVGMGAAGGAVMGGAGEALGAAVAPRMGADAAALAGKGVQMTPGQMVGGLAKGGEDVAKSFPLLGHFITSARGRSIQSFNTATINQALEPIGATLPKTVKPGNDAVKAAGSAVSKAYDAVLGRIPSVAHDADLKTAIDAVIVDARRDPDIWRKFAPRLKDVQDKFAKGPIDGKEYKRIDSELAAEARGYARSDDVDKRMLGQRLRDLRGALTDAVERQYPAEAPDLVAANNAYAMLTRIEQAAGRRKTSEGVFTPADLLQASAAQAQGVSRGGVRREFANGDSLFQKWGQLAQRVLPSEIPDSGTAGRLLAADLAAGVTGMGGAMLNPAAAIGTAGALSAASIPYTGPVNRAIQGYMTRSAPAVRDSLGGLAGVAAPGVGESASRRKGDNDVSPPPSIR